MLTLHATYRLQFEPSFRFADAAALAPLLAALGVSHVYASPVFEAVPGSCHGYDVVDPGRVRDELGGDAEWRQMVATLANHGLGVIVDIVPNHLSIRRNAWWSDVLERGRRSPYFSYFDLSFDDPEGPATIVIPLLAEPYGAELEAGRLTLVHEHGRILVAYGDERFPLAPGSLDTLLADEAGGPDALVARLNADRQGLHALLEAQHYRLAWWRLARDESPYRRFFDINALIATRVERDEVFEALHRLPLSWVRDGLVDGLRIDHVDGLADPSAYLQRLRGELPDAWIGVEKILAPDEAWPGWPVNGTTGYEFGALVTRLFTPPEAEAPLTAFHEAFTTLPDRYEDVAREARHEMLADWLLGDAERVALILHERCQSELSLRDYSQRDCLLLVQELVSQAPVYRTYVASGKAPPRDAAILTGMFDRLRLGRPDLPAPLVAFAAALCLEPGADAAFVTRLQQLCTAVAAKAIEDTAFYRYTRFIAHNDVGGDPSCFSEPVTAFHHTVRRWQAEQPLGLRATSTHDAKRGEDVRARLTMIAERVEPWMAQVTAWHERLAPLRIDGQPDANFEYYLYQSLVGAWPVSRDRTHEHAEKAMREAKLFTNWATPSPEYERAVHRFVNGLFDDGRFATEVEGLVATLHPGAWHKSLAQVLLKITTPGVPDFYQGAAHGWLLSLSDPDNRRPVDHEPLAAALASLDGLSAEDVAGRMAQGLPKLWVTTRALALRARHPGLDPSASYEPIAVRGGEEAENVVAFVRGREVAVLVPTRGPASGWNEARVDLPSGTWTDVLTDRQVQGGEQPVRELWRIFPVALLERRAG
jgi:(1->4)-alpha-D-glucan 1-alpha-D-glucosylmutase